ncbi:hypothetical protein MY149_12450 [Acinetobacter indicus]|nr:hypothetical protein [Acinetobacter indicus]
MYAIYLLYQWGLIINNYELCNYCAEALEKNLETFLLNISYLHRSHIFLFDIIFDKIRKISYQGLTKAEVTNINWRLLRAKTWISDIRMNSYVSEYNLSKNAVISKKLENREIYISYSDSLILKAKIATDPNDLITLNFNDLFPSHIIFYIQKIKLKITIKIYA